LPDKLHYNHRPVQQPFSSIFFLAVASLLVIFFALDIFCQQFKTQPDSATQNGPQDIIGETGYIKGCQENTAGKQSAWVKGRHQEIFCMYKMIVHVFAHNSMQPGLYNFPSVSPV
jgi:hypothetical protein